MAGSKSVGTEQGSTGLTFAQGGTIEEEIHPNLAGRRAMLTYRDMADNDPLISAIMYSIDMLVRQVDWKVEQADSTDKDVEFIEGCMDDMSHSWSDFISEIMSMLRFGFSFHEIVYKQRKGSQKETGSVPSSRFNDGKIGWRKLPVRAQETLDHWEMTDVGGLKAFVQKAPPLFKEVSIPIEKGLLFRTTTFKGNPEGRSLLRGAYRPWYYKKRIEEIEGVGIERDLAGFPVFHVPASYLATDAPDNEKAVVAAFTQIGKNLRRDKQEFMLMPRAYDESGNLLFEFELKTSGGARSFDTSAIIGRYDQRIAMTVLADFILLGHEKVGSFALSSDKTDLFGVALGTILDVVEDVLNRFAIPRLWELNGFNLEKMPKITHGDIEDPNLEQLGVYLQALASLGMTMFPDEDLEAFLRNVAHLPEVSEETKKAREAGQEGGASGEQEPTPGQEGPFSDSGPPNPPPGGEGADSGAQGGV